MLGIFRYVLRNLILFLTEINIYKFLIATIPEWLDLLQKKNKYHFQPIPRDDSRSYKAKVWSYSIRSMQKLQSMWNCALYETPDDLINHNNTLDRTAAPSPRLPSSHCDKLGHVYSERSNSPGISPGISCRLTCNQPVFCDIKFNFSFPTFYAWCPRDNFKPIMFPFLPCYRLISKKCYPGKFIYIYRQHSNSTSQIMAFNWEVIDS